MLTTMRIRGWGVVQVGIVGGDFKCGGKYRIDEALEGELEAAEVSTGIMCQMLERNMGHSERDWGERLGMGKWSGTRKKNLPTCSVDLRLSDRSRHSIAVRRQMQLLQAVRQAAKQLFPSMTTHAPGAQPALNLRRAIGRPCAQVVAHPLQANDAGPVRHGNRPNGSTCLPCCRH